MARMSSRSPSSRSIASEAILAQARSAWADANRTRSTSAPAHAVGVLNAECATSSATVRSVSWPMPVHTGIGDEAMARAMSSLSSAARSVRAPPPRTSATTSAPRRYNSDRRGRDGDVGLDALHPRVDRHDLEPDARCLELVDEVGVGRR